MRINHPLIWFAISSPANITLPTQKEVVVDSAVVVASFMHPSHYSACDYPTTCVEIVSNCIYAPQCALHDRRRRRHGRVWLEDRQSHSQSRRDRTEHVKWTGNGLGKHWTLIIVIIIFHTLLRSVLSPIVIFVVNYTSNNNSHKHRSGSWSHHRHHHPGQQGRDPSSHTLAGWLGCLWLPDWAQLAATLNAQTWAN